MSLESQGDTPGLMYMAFLDLYTPSSEVLCARALASCPARALHNNQLPGAGYCIQSRHYKDFFLLSCNCDTLYVRNFFFFLLF